MLKETNILTKPLSPEALQRDDGERFALVISNEKYLQRTAPDGIDPIHPELYAMVRLEGSAPDQPPELTRIHKMVGQNDIFRMVYLEDHVAAGDPAYDAKKHIRIVGKVNAFDGSVLGQTRAIDRMAVFPPELGMDERRYDNVLDAAQADAAARVYLGLSPDQKARSLALFKDNLRREIMAGKPRAPGAGP